MCTCLAGLTSASASWIVRVLRASNERENLGRQRRELRTWQGSLRGRDRPGALADEDDSWLLQAAEEEEVRVRMKGVDEGCGWRVKGESEG